MKYLLILAMIAVVGIGGYLWFATQSDTPEKDTPVANDEGNELPDEPLVNDTVQVYRNDEWGIAFEYPSDWEIREPAFGSSVSLFNLAIESEVEKKLPRPILINLTPREWIVSALEKMRMRGVETQDTVVAGLAALKLEDQDMGIPTISYLILVDGTYWVDVSGKKEYEDVLNQVLESFRITPVEIPSQ